jgi:hypothetical protein
MKKTREPAESAPKFPYTTKPGSLRKFLAMVPQKPKPAKINQTLLKSWGFKDTNDASIIRVLKAVGLVGADNLPTEDYVAFMHKGTGPACLAQKIRQLYPALFETSHTPHKEPTETLQNLFNIHSGGSSGTITQQIQTFKALCDHADFSETAAAMSGIGTAGATSRDTRTGGSSAVNGAPIHIDLHIHLPGNKTRRDYEYMFEDIARYIFGRMPQPPSAPERSE